MTPIRAAYLEAADSAVALLADPAVASAWARPSALAGLSVGGLAAHLAGQVTFVPHTLDQPPPESDPVGLMGHYARVAWIGADLDADINVAIRSDAERGGSAGAAAVAGAAAATVAALRARLVTEPAGRLVSPPAGPWALALDDFLVTRMMEIAVHSDDLAVSVGVATPELAESVLGPVLELLSSLAIRRHGATALLRALSRAERAPATIAAF